MTELLPCPFCGSEPKLYTRGGAWGVKCTCDGTAFIHTYGGTQRGNAVAAWNRRAASPVQAGIDPLVAEIIQRLESHMGQQAVPVLLQDCRQAAALLRAHAERIAALEVERDANHNLAVANGERAKEEHARAEAAESRLAEAREALENAAGFLDTPISRRRNQGDSFFLETVKSIRATLSRLKPGEKGGE